MKRKNTTAVLYAILAAVFYALNTPFSKLLLDKVPTTFMASFLYLGAGAGIGIMYIFHFKKENLKAVEGLDGRFESPEERFVQDEDYKLASVHGIKSFRVHVHTVLVQRVPQ